MFRIVTGFLILNRGNYAIMNTKYLQLSHPLEIHHGRHHDLVDPCRRQVSQLNADVSEMKLIVLKKRSLDIDVSKAYYYWAS